MKKYGAEKIKTVKRNGLSFYSMILMGAVAFIAAFDSEAQQTSTSASSTQGTSQTKIEEVKPETASTKKFGLDATIEGSSNLIETGSYENSQEASYVIIPNYKLTDKIKISSEITFVHNLKQAAESDFKNTPIGASYSAIPLVGEELTIKPSLSILLPTNTEARDTTSFYGGVGIGQALAFKMSKIGLPATLTYGSSIRRNIHEYTNTSSGSSNTAYSITNYLRGDLEISEKFSFTAKGTLLSGLTYNDSWRSRFEILEEVGYSINDTVSVALGHANTEATLKSDMTSSNVEFFNNNTSSIYLDLNVTY